MSTHIDLHAMFDLQASLRSLEAAEYPEDERNIVADGLLNNLAAAAQRGEFTSELVELYTLFAVAADTAQQVVKEESQLLREVGFHFFPNCIDDFLEEVLKRMRRQS